MKILRKILTCFILCAGIILGSISFVGCGSAVEIEYKIISSDSVMVSKVYYNGSEKDIRDRSIEIPDIANIDGKDYSVTCIGSSAFREANVAHVELPETLTKIESRAFDNDYLEVIPIPAAVQYIASDAFAFCESLMRFDVAPGNTAFAEDAHGALYTKDFSTLIRVPSRYDYGDSGTFEIPEGCETIENFAFCETNFDTIKISSTVCEIKESTYSSFYGCDNLETVIIDSQYILNSFTQSSGLLNVVDRIYINEELDVSNATYLLSKFTSIDSSKIGYIAYVRNA